MKAEKYSRAWWAARLPIINAFAQGKEILVSGVSSIAEGRVAFDLDISVYSIAPDPVELWVVLDHQDKVVAMQPNFGSADTIRASKDSAHTDRDGDCYNRHRVIHMKEVSRG